ncbi:hypothetical protein FRC03_000628 [Tulasnella sp. 419]|nr:hypothetical protein FRC02_005654 [Tulasnella sp. 418]KAG8969802.1 hypothetical protein FRC03_000628 [Tulasnella sp. 419]
MKLFLYFITVAAALQIAIASPVANKQRETNADRMARGLPPLVPIAARSQRVARAPAPSVIRRASARR